MRLPRFFVARLEGELVELDANESRHAERVLRVREGGRVILFDEQGRECEAEIVRVGKTVQARIVQVREARRDLPIRVTAACAVPKGKRLEFMVQKLAELGAARFVPVVFARSVARLGEARRARCEQVAREAAKQCGRASLLAVEPEIPLEEFLEERFGVLLSGRPEAPRTIGQALSREWPASAAFIVGPEGGMTAEEEARVTAAGAEAVCLAPTILRIETAALAFMAHLAGR